MIYQIKINENNVIEVCSMGGLIEGGIDVEFIPEEVFENPQKWLYINGEYLPNPNPPEPEPEDEPTQDDINLDFDFRLSCLELGL